ncbi:MAG: ABC transporter permease [Psittacicella sp.]
MIKIKKIDLHSIRYFYDLLLTLTKKEIKVKYKNNFFGYLWTLGNPLLFTLVYYIVFKTVMRLGIHHYAVFLITALLPWQWINNAIVNNLFTFLSNAQIIKKTKFPKSTLPFSVVLTEAFNFILSIPVILFFLWLANIHLHIIDYLIWIPILCAIQTSICYGIGLITSSLNIFFRDLERIIQIFFMLLFYLTPILYTPNMVPKKYLWVINLNPFTSIIVCWRNLFMTGKINYYFLSNSIIFSLLSLTFGFIIFNWLKYKFAEVL